MGLFGKKVDKQDALRQKQIKKQQKLLKKQDRLKAKKKKNVRVALCLGGGGARGFAHVGALKAFEEEDIKFDLCVGTSVGSIIGALYCAGVSPKDILERGDKLNMKEIKKGFIFQPDDSRKVGKLVQSMIGDKNIEDLNIPFACVAVDLVQGKQVIFDKGSVAEAVSASSTLPIAFRPLIKGDMHLVDGGLLNNIPADICRLMGADYVVTIDVNPTRGSGTEDVGLLSVIKASFNIMSINASYNGIINSDVLISTDTSKYKSMDKTGYMEMYELGYKAAKEKINEIKALMYKK